MLPGEGKVKTVAERSKAVGRVDFFANEPPIFKRVFHAVQNSLWLGMGTPGIECDKRSHVVS